MHKINLIFINTCNQLAIPSSKQGSFYILTFVLTKLLYRKFENINYLRKRWSYEKKSLLFIDTHNRLSIQNK